MFLAVKPDWGDVPTWISAVIALVALIGLGVTVYFAYKAFTVSTEALRVSMRAHETAHNLLEVELARDEENRQDRRDRDVAERRAQADRIGAWFGFGTGEERPGPGYDRHWGAQVKNASHLPVYDVAATFFIVQSSATSEVAEYVEVDSPPTTARVIPPGSTKTLGMPPGSFGSHGRVDQHEYVVGLAFRDAAGVRWERDPYGKLTELASS